MRSPPQRLAAAMAPDATPGVTSNSLARERVSSSVALISWRANSRFQMRARTWDGGWRSSRAKVIRRRDGVTGLPSGV